MSDSIIEILDLKFKITYCPGETRIILLDEKGSDTDYQEVVTRQYTVDSVRDIAIGIGAQYYHDKGAECLG